MEVKEFKSGEFVRVVGDDLKENGIEDGSFLYLAGDTFIREQQEDPYLFRKAFVAAQVNGYHIDTENKPFLVTAKNFGDVDERDLLLLQEVYLSDFGEEEEESALPN